MTWVVPGQPFDVMIEGKTVTLKSLTIGERMGLARGLQDIPEESTHIEKLYNMVTANVLSIEGVGEQDLGHFIACQSDNTILALWTAIIKGSALSESESKNLPSSSAPSNSESLTGTAQNAERANAGTEAT